MAPRAAGGPPAARDAGEARSWILHVDLDQFLAAVEVRRHPELRGLPVVVGGAGDPTQSRVVVSTASYEARASGVRSGMPLREAARRCPQAQFFPVDKPAADAASLEVMQVLRTVTDQVEVWGWDEAYLVVEADDAEDAQLLAAQVRERVLADTGLSCAVGVGDSKLRAKTATGFAKPGGVAVLTAATWLPTMAGRPTYELWGVGTRTAARLTELGITTVGQLEATEPAVLAAAFGPTTGPGLQRLATGDDGSRVDPVPRTPTSHGRQHTFPDDLTTPEQVRSGVEALAREVAAQVFPQGHSVTRVMVTGPELVVPHPHPQRRRPTSRHRRAGRGAGGARGAGAVRGRPSGAAARGSGGVRRRRIRRRARGRRRTAGPGVRDSGRGSGSGSGRDSGRGSGPGSGRGVVAAGAAAESRHVRGRTGMGVPSPVLHLTMSTRFAVVGDSIAFGTGARSTADSLGPRLTRDLEQNGLTVELRVFAVPGARSADLGAQVAHAVRWRPDVVLVVIGANDLTHFVPPAQAADQLRAAVRALRSAGAEVVVAPAPDLGVVPHVPPAMRPLVSAGSAVLRRMQEAVVREEGGRLPDSDTSAAFATDTSLFSADRFHPSSAGYAAIATALAPVVRAAARQVREQASGTVAS